MKRFDNFNSLKESSTQNINKFNPNLEIEVKNFVKLLRNSVINISKENPG